MQDDCLPEDLLHVLHNFEWLKLSAGSKIGQQVSFSVNSINNHGAVVISGSGAAISKVFCQSNLIALDVFQRPFSSNFQVVTVAEIVKRRLRGLHQLNRISQKEVIEFWDPKIPELETLKVTRLIPMLVLCLSCDPVLKSVSQVKEVLFITDFWDP